MDSRVSCIGIDNYDKMTNVKWWNNVIKLCLRIKARRNSSMGIRRPVKSQFSHVNKLAIPVTLITLSLSLFWKYTYCVIRENRITAPLIEWPISPIVPIGTPYLHIARCLIIEFCNTLISWIYDPRQNNESICWEGPARRVPQGEGENIILSEFAASPKNKKSRVWSKIRPWLHSSFAVS